MSKLEDLVPPLDICRKIPAGDFVKTCFVWLDDNTPVGYMSKVVPWSEDIHASFIYKAPTFQEIWEEMAKYRNHYQTLTIEAEENGICAWAFIPYRIKAGAKLVEFRGTNPPEVLLKLFLCKWAEDEEKGK